ncbi:MAG: cytochrome c oxidase assembly protein [Thioalkalispiraceae bacterium]|jgi:putative membrane protein
MSSLITLLSPWEFSPTVLLCSLAAAGLYWRGLRQRQREGLRTGIWRSLSFFIGLFLIYAVMQTYLDYLSQHMFWVHRFQHLVLHHLGPFLIMLAVPHEVLGHAIPANWRRNVLLPLWNSWPVRGTYRFLQNPVVAPLLFVGLIYIWLIPSVHFEAMLSEPRYKLMNWSMLLDGLLFWWLMLDPRMPHEHRTLRYPIRILLLWAVMVVQIILGAHIALSQTDLYDVYSVCGRAWPISAHTDQVLGGLTTWIPAAMMSVLAILLVIRMWMRQSEHLNKLATSAQGNN